ncbi:hypothetical protein [Nannocystis pusilla]|uniref:hypothetical protein n=1 Tax=Nannocystis pusilla TaxID=889268 RepID=UPI003BF3BE5F
MDEQRGQHGGEPARTRRSVPGAAVMLAAALACKPAAVGTTSPTVEQEVAAKRRADPELQAMADRLDPGPQRPLSELMPAWLKSQVDAALPGDPRSPKALAEAREALAVWDRVKTSDTQAMLQGGLVFGRGLVLAERAVLAGSDDPELLAALAKAYRVVMLLKMFRHSGVFGQLVSMAVELARTEGKAETLSVEEVLAVAAHVEQRAPDLQRHTTARLLREHPRHPTVSETLLRASQTELERERWREAIDLRALAVARMGEGATGPDYVELAAVRYKGLDVENADKARKEAEARGPAEPGEDKAAAFRKKLAELDTFADAARRVLALTDPSGLAEQNERGHLLLKLGHMRDAEAIFVALQKAHPYDARPRTGMAMLRIHRGLDFFGAADEIRPAHKMTGRDRLYYEVALGTVPMMLFGKIMTQIAEAPGQPIPELAAHFEEMLELAAGFREYDPARAAVLEVLFTMVREAIPKYMADKRTAVLVAVMRKLPEKALALTKKFPESRDVWRLAFASTRLNTDAAKAKALATARLPASMQQDPDLRLQQARALVDMALLWEDRTLLAAAAEAAANLPAEVNADTAAMTRATIDAVLGFQGDKAALQRAIDTFAAVAERKTGNDQALALNNAAMVAGHDAGPTAAMPLLERAYEADPANAAPLYNMSALRFAMHAHEGLPEVFALVVKYGKIAGLRLHARAWLITLAEAGLGDVAATRQEFAAALAKEQAEESRGRLQLGRWAVLDQNDFKVSLEYSTTEGLTLLDEVVTRWWLFAPAPTMEALLVSKLGKVKAAKL